MESKILNLLGQGDYAPSNVPELISQLRLKPGQQQELQAVLSELMTRGLIVRTKGNRYIQSREADLIPGGEYTLEVSSPGVERKLSRPRDFEKSVGKKVKVVVREPVAGATTWIGMLQAFTGEVLTVETADGKTAQIPLDRVKKANLKFEW